MGAMQSFDKKPEQKKPPRVLRVPKEKDDADKLGTPTGADLSGLAVLDPLTPALQEAARITLKKIALEFEKKGKVNPKLEDLEKQQNDAFDLQLQNLHAETLREKLKKKRKKQDAFETVQLKQGDMDDTEDA